MMVRRYSSAVSPLACASPARFFIAAVIRMPSTALILANAASPITNRPVLALFAAGFFCLGMAQYSTNQVQQECPVARHGKSPRAQLRAGRDNRNLRRLDPDLFQRRQHLL